MWPRAGSSQRCIGELEINIMSRRLSRISLALVLFLSSEVWALGLGDITMNSGLNQPLNARIELLSATPEELDNLTITLASADTFARYGIDRPFFLQDMQFNVFRSGRADGNYVQVTSMSPMAEPFLTFLVEASWSRGRLLREYTVFLDPPTFAPQTADTAPPVQAPTRVRRRPTVLVSSAPRRHRGRRLHLRRSHALLRRQHRSRSKNRRRFSSLNLSWMTALTARSLATTTSLLAATRSGAWPHAYVLTLA